MIYAVSFKRKLGLISFAVLASLLCPQDGFAMESENTTLTSSTKASQLAFTLKLRDINDLIRRAKDHDLEAQNQLMALHYQGHYHFYLTPEKIGFFEWKAEDSEETILNRCTRDDFYASYIIFNSDKLQEKLTEPFIADLFLEVKERADKGTPHALNNLGWMYEKSLILNEKAKERARLFERLCNTKPSFESDNEDESDNEGLILGPDDHYNSNLIISQLVIAEFNSKGEALPYFKAAADQNDPHGQLNLAYMNKHYDLFIKGGRAAAVHFYQLAADQGLAVANFYLGEISQDREKTIRFYKLAADQEIEEAQVALINCYHTYKEDMDDEIDYTNAIEVLHWCVKSRGNLPHLLAEEYKMGQANFFQDKLSINPQAPFQGEDFQDMLGYIRTGNKVKLNEEEGLSRLIREHQYKIIMNSARGSSQNMAIPELANRYKPIAEVEIEALNMMALLQNVEPGFMVTQVALSEELKKELPNQITPFFSVDELDGISYLTMGEENVSTAHKFVNFLKESDQKFTEAITKLQAIEDLYQQGLNAAFTKLLTKQQKVFKHKNDDKDGECLKAFEKKQKKYDDLKGCLDPLFKEFKEERDLLTELQKKIKSLPAAGLGSRNKEFWESDEYAFLRD